MPGGLGAGGLGATLGRAGMREASSEPGGSASTDHEAAAPVEAVLLAGASCRPQGLALPEPRSRVERRSRKHLDLGVASPRFGRAKALPSLSRLRRGAGSDALSAAASPLARLPEAYRWSSYRAATALAAGPPRAGGDLQHGGGADPRRLSPIRLHASRDRRSPRLPLPDGEPASPPERAGCVNMRSDPGRLFGSARTVTCTTSGCEALCPCGRRGDRHLPGRGDRDHDRPHRRECQARSDPGLHRGRRR